MQHPSRRQGWLPVASERGCRKRSPMQNRRACADCTAQIVYVRPPSASFGAKSIGTSAAHLPNFVATASIAARLQPVKESFRSRITQRTNFQPRPCNSLRAPGTIMLCVFKQPGRRSWTLLYVSTCSLCAPCSRSSARFCSELSSNRAERPPPLEKRTPESNLSGVFYAF